MSLPLVPGEQEIREPVIGKSRHRSHHRIAEQRRQPAVAGRYPPHRDRDIGADDRAAGFIGRVQAAAHVVDRGAIGRQRIGLFVDVFEGEGAGADGGQQLVALPVDAGVADGAAGCTRVRWRPVMLQLAYDVGVPLRDLWSAAIETSEPRYLSFP
jgi:hypothetical protein